MSNKDAGILVNSSVLQTTLTQSWSHRHLKGLCHVRIIEAGIRQLSF